MRSVLIFPTMDSGRVVELLDSMGERLGQEWFGIADRTVEVSMEECRSPHALLLAMVKEGESSPKDIASLASVLDQIAGYWVEVRVSGRVNGRDEMLDVVRRLLAQGGYGMDDHSEGVWTLQEIEQGRSSGETFRL